MRLKAQVDSAKSIWNYEIRRNTQEAEEAPLAKGVGSGNRREVQSLFLRSIPDDSFFSLRQMSEKKNKKVVDKRVNIW